MQNRRLSKTFSFDLNYVDDADLITRTEEDI